jgi:RNA polymerase sigma-70 factor (ECF subfamily)
MEDQSIVDLLYARDESALKEADRKYGGYCREIAMNILHNDSDCAECLNDLWLRLWHTVPPTRPENLKLYLASITRNLAFDRYKEARRQKRGGGEVCEPIEEIRELVADSSSVEDAFDSRELSRAISRFLLSLPDRERGVFVRRYYFADDTRQIAKRYSMRKPAVLTMLCRTRSKLKEYLNEEGYLV